MEKISQASMTIFVTPFALSVSEAEDCRCSHYQTDNFDHFFSSPLLLFSSFLPMFNPHWAAARQFPIFLLNADIFLYLTPV